MCFSILNLAFAKYSLLHGSSYLVWIFSLRRDFSTEVRKNILPYEVITLSAAHYLCSLERKCVQGSQRESLRKHLGAFLRCLRGDNAQPGSKDVEETGGGGAKVHHESGGINRRRVPKRYRHQNSI